MTLLARPVITRHSLATSTPSRSTTLAAVLDVVVRAALDEKARAEICAALRTIQRVLNRPLDQIPADANALRRRLDQVSPIAAGLSVGRWANIRWHLRSALRLAKGHLPRTPKPPMAPP